MTLKDNLYKIVAQHSLDDNNTIYEIQLNQDCEIYNAHFPGEPITPGVCVVQIAQELFADYMGKPATLISVKNVKFINVISPIESPIIQFEIKIGDYSNGVYQVQSVAKNNTGNVFAKISIKCHIL